MAGTFSFDVVSDFDRQELVNAIDQALREIHTRYDLKDSKSEIKLEETRLLITSRQRVSPDRDQGYAGDQGVPAQPVAQDLRLGQAEEAGGIPTARWSTLRKGIADDLARKIGKQIRDNFPKAQPQMQGDALRVRPRTRTICKP